MGSGEMNTFSTTLQKPLGQVLLATLLFCFIFTALFVGLYKAGTAYLFKERSRRAVNMTALSAGAVYANGLQLVRESNILLMTAAAFDAWTIGSAVSAAALAPPPLDIAGIIAAAKVADPHTRDGIQKAQATFFGIDLPTGPYPELIFGQAAVVAGENGLSQPPLFAYNHPTATAENVMMPNMALRFRSAAELLPDTETSSFSLTHDGIKHTFSPDEVEPAHNPLNPSQMRVRKDFPSPYSGWWVRREKDGSNSAGGSFLTKIAPLSVLKQMKGYLEKFKLDVTDRDDPPCHTFALLGVMPGNIGGQTKRFFQLGETRVTADGLAAWDILHPITTHLEKVDLDSSPVLTQTLQTLKNIPGLNPMIKSSEILDGL